MNDSFLANMSNTPATLDPQVELQFNSKQIIQRQRSFNTLKCDKIAIRENVLKKFLFSGNKIQGTKRGSPYKGVSMNGKKY